LQRLSSGKRITSPSDDAGGLAVGMKIQSALKRAAASRLNTQNGTSFLQMQDGVLKIAGEILDRMAELKSFYNDVSKSDLDRDTYNHEFKELQTELNMLKGQKFNGVSLFATTQGDNNPLKIITSDDGLGDPIQLQRNGLFENFKSRFGADGRLNTGSHGEYRQVVGEFIRDGGMTDATPGYTSRAYSEGDVVFKRGPQQESSGYFMALSDVLPGTKIQDTYGATSLWIRLADQNGNGFAEAYPQAPVYDHTNLKFNAEGEEVAYLQGETVKIPAHWASKGSYIFLKAQADIPRGVDLASLFDNGQVGDNGLFDYVGVDRSNGATTDDMGKPLTEFLRTNDDLPMPSVFVNGDAVGLAAIMRSNYTNGLNPGHVLTSLGIYAPAGDWGAQTWNNTTPFNEGDLVLNVSVASNPRMLQMNGTVMGRYSGGDYDSGSFVMSQGQWFTAESVVTDEVPYAGSASDIFVSLSNAYSAGDFTTAIDGAGNPIGLRASDVMKGNISGMASALEIGDVVAFSTGGGATMTYSEMTVKHHGTWSNVLSGVAATETVVGSDGNIYQLAGAGSDPTVDPTTIGQTEWTQVAGVTGNDLSGNVLFTDVTANVRADGTSASPTNGYFVRHAWQYGVPDVGNGGATNVTSAYADVNNKTFWAKTHYTHLQGKSVSTSYTRGDNIFYQGKNYIYTSNLSSDNSKYSKYPGYTEFGDLLSTGAVRELPMYIDTIGGGGSSSLPAESYFRPNEDLKFVDRLPSGEVRTANMARRTDSPLPPGDEIFNSADDAFFGGLQAGNDGLYGTADDYYEAMAFEDRAKASPHVDADADNNKNLLDANNGLADFSVADFVDFIQTLANVRAVNGGTMSRLGYAERILEENEINLGAARSRIMDTDMALESTRMARQNVLVQAAASMVSQANSLNNVVLSLLQ